MSHRIANRLLLPIVSVLGLSGAVAVVLVGARAPSGAKPLDRPAQSTFAASVAGAGLVEPASEFISVGTEVAGVVVEAPVIAGMRVAKGDVILRLDDRVARAELAARQADATLSAAALAKLKSAPRSEEIPPVEARVLAAEAAFSESESMLSLIEGVGEANATSRDEVARRRFQHERRRADLEEARAAVALVRAGSWAPDIAVAESSYEAAMRRVDAARTELERRTLRVPIDGEILQVNARLGEFVQAGGNPPIVMGRTDELRVRVDVDENEAWRVRTGAKATASLRGNSSKVYALEFVRIEPYVIPKRSLTGLSTERVDTRVLQVIYRLPAASGDATPYPGQQVDVFIEADAR